MEEVQALIQNMGNEFDICYGVVQEYLCYIQGVAPEVLFPEGLHQVKAKVFRDSKGNDHPMILHLTDDMMYNIDLSKCYSKVVTDEMSKTCGNLQFMTQYLIFYLFKEKKDKLPHPEYFQNARLAFTPYTTGFLYSPETGAKFHNEFHKRIAFKWL